MRSRLWLGRLFHISLLGVILVAGSTTRSGAAGPSDALLDAKRKAAAQLLRDGKAGDALALLTEVVATDDSLYSDHLLMAHAHEKLGQSAEALAQYRRLAELLPKNPANNDERLARQEADKKLKLADPMAAKVDAAVDEHLRKLDALEREAISTRNMTALQRIFRLRGMTWQAEKMKGHACVEVFAYAKEGWQPANLMVKEGEQYHVRAAGTWRVMAGGTAPVECTANGPTQKKVPSYGGVCGQLMAGVKDKYVMLGEDMTFTAPASGPLMLIEAENQSDRTHNAGSLQVLIYPN